MTVTLSQINPNPYLVWPAQLAGFLLLLLYLLVLGVTVYRHGRELRQLGAWKWAALLLGVLLAPLFSTTLAIELPGINLPPPTGIPVDPRVPALLPLAFLPVVWAAGWLGVTPAILVAAAGGLARALWGTNRVFTVVEWMLAGSLLGILIRQDYRGRLPRLVCFPFVAALLSSLIAGLAAYLSFLIDDSGAGLASLETVATQWRAYGLPLVVELLLAGVAGEAVRMAVPKIWVAHESRRPPPYSTSLNNRLLYILIPLIFLGILVLAVANHGIATNVATAIVVDQMGRDAQIAANGIPFFVRTGDSLIRDLARDERLQNADVAERTARLADRSRTVPYFSQLVYFDGPGTPAGAYPESAVTGLDLSRSELAAVELALQGVPRSVTVYPQQPDEAVTLAFVAPVIDPGADAVVGALLGRANIEANPLMEPVINSLQGLLVGTGAGFITDEDNRIILHPEDRTQIGEIWEPLDTDDVLATSLEASRAYRDRAADGTPQLVYYLPAEGHPWQVVVVVPNQAVRDQATQITIPLFVILFFFGSGGVVALLLTSNHLTRPLKTLTAATDRIARGQMDEPVEVTGEDEVGRLGEAFEKMRARLRARLEELNLLLRVSQAVAGSLSLEDSLPPILEGAHYASQAFGARLLVITGDDSTSMPHTFARGSGAPGMAPLDSEIASLVETEGQIVIENLARARAVLDVSKVLEHIQALIALPLRHEASYLGVLWLGFDRPHKFTETEINFLTTLAGQAAVAIANARLFAASEGGRQRLQAILSSTPDAVIVTDRRDRLLLINPAAETVFQVAAGVADGRLVSEVVDQAELLDLLCEQDTTPAPREIPFPDGRTLFASASPIVSADGSVLGRVAVLRDVTHFKQLDQLKTEFVATVSHDLRAPLTFMRGYTTMLPMVGELNAKQQEFVEKIMVGVEQMSELIDNLLDLNRIEAGVGVAREVCRMSDVVQNAVTHLRAMADHKDISLLVNLDSNLPSVLGDSTLLRQAISNLVDNALKYTDAGGVVQVTGTVRDAGVVVAIKDSGIGVSHTDQVRLFEKFYRVKHKDTANVKGSGLGLAIVKSIAEHHGGSVWVESRLGQGSTFYFCIPTQPDPTPTLSTAV